MKKYSVLLIDDEEIILDTLGNDLKDNGYNVFTCNSGETGIDLFKQHSPDLVLVDLLMPGIGGIDVAKAVIEFKPDVKVIVLTGYGTLDSAIEALRLGVSDFLIKPCDRKVLSRKISKHLEDDNSWKFKTALDKAICKLGDYKLTARELEICKMLLIGKTREEISATLFISKNTVDTHVKNIYKKLKVCSFSKLLEKLLDGSPPLADLL